MSLHKIPGLEQTSWRIIEEHQHSEIRGDSYKFLIWDGKLVWEHSNSPRHRLTVHLEMKNGDPKYGFSRADGVPQISWSSTSDRDIKLALCVAHALQLAYGKATS